MKVYVDGPGVYEVRLDGVGSPEGRRTAPPAEDLRLVHQDRELPYWIEDGTPGCGPCVLFVADTAMFQPRSVQDASPSRVVLIEGNGPTGTTARPPGPARRLPPVPAVAPARLERATVWRLLHLEQNMLRAGVTMGDAGDVDTLWYWAMLTQQGSSQLEVDLGQLGHRRSDGELDLDVTIRLLGWSRTTVPEGTSQHHVDVYLNDQKIGEGAFNGRRPLSLHIHGVPATAVRDGSNQLRIKVPARVDPSSPDPILDIVYVDWIEARYRAGSPLADGTAPLILGASAEPRWLPDPAGTPSTRLLAATGWSAPRRPEGGWVVPPGVSTELWIVDRGDIRRPLAVEPASTGVGSLSARTDYLMIAPPELTAGAERLADFHRRLGRTVAVVGATAVYDEFGGGECSAAAIRRFLDAQADRLERLRWVLLVGDADWFEPDDRSPCPQPGPSDHNKVPSWTYLSRYGPAADDNFFAADPHDQTVPRFAVGRLPVVDAATLDAYTSKVIAWAARPRRSGSPSVLMLSDASTGSRLQQQRMLHRFADLAVDLVTPDPDASRLGPDAAALAGFARHPWLVYFGGHGSRYVWELGDPGDPKPESFFDRGDVARLEPTIRQPIALSMSCATAPFDHPSATSLGEVMVLSGDRGAVAFIGASAPLHTPPRFGESLVRDLLTAETLGDAFAAAKRQTHHSAVSHLYNLLGDPGLPLTPQHPDTRADEQ